MTLQSDKNNQEAGSVLLWILIAIVLLAGLTTVINQDSRTSGSALTDRQAQLHAIDITSYGNDIKQAVQKLLLNGKSENDLSFGNGVFKNNNGDTLIADNHNTNCSDDDCKVFHIVGGGISAQELPAGAVRLPNSPSPSDPRPGSGQVITASMDGIGTDARDLVFMFPNIHRDVCLKINSSLNVTNPSGEPPSFSAGASTAYNGSFAAFSTTYSGGTVNNHPAYCYLPDGSVDNYTYVVTLQVR